MVLKYQMGTQNMLRTHEEKYDISEQKNQIYDCFRSNQMPYTDQMTEITPYVLTYFLVTI